MTQAGSVTKRLERDWYFHAFLQAIEVKARVTGEGKILSLSPAASAKLAR